MLAPQIRNNELGLAYDLASNHHTLISPIKETFRTTEYSFKLPEYNTHFCSRSSFAFNLSNNNYCACVLLFIMPKSKVSKKQQKASAAERLRKARATKQPSVSLSSDSALPLSLNNVLISPSIQHRLLLPAKLAALRPLVRILL